MNNYMIYTDSACDIRPELLRGWNVECINLAFHFEDGVEQTGDKTDIRMFYQKMRDGGVARTTAVNPEAFVRAFEPVLASGRDILYLGFSSGLSATYNSSCIAAEELRQKYPERRIVAVDTLCASAGQGLLVYLSVQKKAEGASIDEVASYAEKIKLSICHWFTVDDLVYLKRGGRVSSAVAFVGSVLGIKPVMHVDDAGKLINVSKARGRKASLSMICDKFGELAQSTRENTVFISHGDCLSDAEELKKQLEKTYGIKVSVITDIGPVIGAHSGPGTIALFFVGKER